VLAKRVLIKLVLVAAPALFYRAGLHANLWPSQDQPISPPVTPFSAPLRIPRVLQSLTRADASPGERALANSIRLQAIEEASAENRPIPPLAKSLDDADYYQIRIKETDIQIPGLPAGKSRVWAYGGFQNDVSEETYPGPTIVATRGRPVVVRFVNQLLDSGRGNPFSVHYHGGHTPSSFDGYPARIIDEKGRVIQPIPPFEQQNPPPSKVYVYPNTSTRGATLWYHDHYDATGTPFESTGHNVYMGLAGFYILKAAPVDSDERSWDQKLPRGPIEATTGLPKFDVPLVIQDRQFNADGSLFYPPFEHDGVLGDTFLVNGAVQPRFEVETRRYRLRFLNGSNARVYQLALSLSRTDSLQPLDFFQIGSDGGLLPKVVRRNSFLISMAERIEVVFDFAPFRGQQVFLNNCMQQTSGRGPDDFTPNACTPLLRFDVSSQPVPDDSIVLHDLDSLLPLNIDELVSQEEQNSAPIRGFKFERSHGGWVVNGEFFEAGQVSVDDKGLQARPRLGHVEIWSLTNSSGGWVHPVHIHLEEFQVVDRNGVPPPPEEQGLKDTFYLGHGDTVRVITRFKAQPYEWVHAGGEDNDGIYVFHCHNLEHEDMHMMGSFRVMP